MRAIKFKAWHTKQQKMYSSEQMVKDQFALLPDGRFANIHGSDTTKSIIFPADVIIPIQWTGLVDKNGVEIYEGDILKLNDGQEYPVEYGDCICTADDNFCGGRAFGFHVNREILGNTEPWSDNATDSKNIEVIRNKYGNPELLENQE